MSKRLRFLLMRPALWVPLGTLWVGGCVTDIALRDFVTTTAIRTIFQTLAAAFQAAIVNAQ